jgi:hypothetical protein
MFIEKEEMLLRGWCAVEDRKIGACAFCVFWA